MPRNSLHASCPVEDGKKWSANYWVWNKPRDFSISLPDADVDEEYSGDLAAPARESLASGWDWGAANFRKRARKVKNTRKKKHTHTHKEGTVAKRRKQTRDRFGLARMIGTVGMVGTAGAVQFCEVRNTDFPHFANSSVFDRDGQAGQDCRAVGMIRKWGMVDPKGIEHCSTSLDMPQRRVGPV